METRDTLKSFLPRAGTNSHSSVICMGKRVVEFKDRAVSHHFELGKFPPAFRAHVDALAARILDPEVKHTIVTGLPMSGKSFLIESFILNSQQYVKNSSMGDLKFFPLNENDMLELRHTEDFRKYVIELVDAFDVSSESELCFVTESLEIADFVAKTVPEVRVILEVNLNVYLSLLALTEKTTNKSWASWQGVDVNFMSLTVEDLTDILNQTVAKRLNEGSATKITKAQIRRFINYVLKEIPSLLMENEEGVEVVTAPPGLWAVCIRYILGEMAYNSSAEIRNENGTLKFTKVCEIVFQQYDDHFSEYSTDGGINTPAAEAIADEVRKILESEGHSVVFAGASPLVDTSSNSDSVAEFNDMGFVTTELSKNIIGQDAAIERTVEGLTIPAAGLNDVRKPLRSFIFLGPTGVGKTELALNLAKVLTKEPMNVVRLNMSEFQMEHEVAKLFGAPPGYLGFDKGGMLTSAVMEHPRSIVLLDEVEKAHPKIWDTFLQILDAGMMTDGQGQVVDFTQTVVIMTSNIGANEMVKTASGFSHGAPLSSSESNKSMSSIAMKALEQTFRPEMVNRIDEVVVFNKLSKDVVKSIIEREIAIVAKTVKNSKGVILTTQSDEVLDFLVAKADISKYGAREVQRVVFRNVTSIVAKYILANKESRRMMLAVIGNEIAIAPTTTKTKRGK